MASGQTVFQVQQTGPCQKAKKIDFEVFVNPDRCPRRERKNKHENDDDDDSYGHDQGNKYGDNNYEDNSFKKQYENRYNY